MLSSTGPAATARGYGAHWPDAESGLLYLGARYYDPVLSRFVEPDPVVPEPGDPQSWNRYSFVRNNPFNRVDPTGSIDTAADIANRYDEFAEDVRSGLSVMVAESGGTAAVVGATTVQTALDLGGIAVDTLRLGEGAAEGGWGYLEDAGRATGIVGGIVGTAEVGSRVIKALRRAEETGRTTRTGIGVTRHGVDQKITRGVKTADELDAIRNPLDTRPVKVDELGRPSQRVVGRKAEVVRNPETGGIVSVNPTSTKKAERLLQKLEEGQ